MASYSWKDGFPLKLLNVGVCFGLLAWNVYSIKTPGGTDYFHGSSRTTYFTPAPWVFSIWVAIHGLFCGTAIYQFTSRGTEVIIDGIPWGIPCLAIFNVAYIYLRAKEHFVAAVFLNLFACGTIGIIYFKIKKHYKSESLGEEVFLHMPFSLMYGWTTYLGYLVLFEAFGVDATTERAGVWTKVFVFLSLSWLKGAVVTSARTNRDFQTAAVIAWCMWAVHVQQTSSGFVHTASMVFFVIALVAIGVTILYRICAHKEDQRLRDEERGPLLSTRR